MIASRSFIESRSAMSVPTRRPASAATGNVTGIGNSVPSASRMSCEHAPEVRLAHEAIERRERTASQHLKVADRAGRDLQRGKVLA